MLLGIVVVAGGRVDDAGGLVVAPGRLVVPAGVVLPWVLVVGRSPLVLAVVW